MAHQKTQVGGSREASHRTPEEVGNHLVAKIKHLNNDVEEQLVNERPAEVDYGWYGNADNTKVTSIACLGDSITVGACASQHRSYPEKLRSKLGETFSVGKYAASGHSVSSFSQKPIWNEQDLLYQALNLNPKIVMIMFGTNDAKSDPLNETSYIQDYTTLINMFKDLSSKPRIYVMHPPPVYHEKFPEKATIAPNVNKRLRVLINAIARKNKLPPPVDVFEAFKAACPDLNGNCPLMAQDPSAGTKYAACKDDWVHPSDEGYEVIARLVKSVILKDLSCDVRPSLTCAKDKFLWNAFGIASR